MTTDATRDRIEQALATHPFSAGLAEAHLRRLASIAHEESYPAGAWILRSDAPADRFHLVTAGRAAVEVLAAGREPTLIATVHPGQVIGWSWATPPYRVHFDVVALDPVATVAVDATELRAACDDDHELGFHVMRRLAAVLAARLESTRHQLVDVYGPAR
ncbi:MAG: cyclic nucleotide-binding domain-containing protein [Ilumatobacteraceae bacterium]|jgi:CRP-like cAMP-binding protein|nr:cyclic nucleotide-binding domain-containing protein [Ilumatobacteraceae bacterium]